MFTFSAFYLNFICLSIPWRWWPFRTWRWWPFGVLNKGGPEGSVLLAVILKNNFNFLLSAINLALLGGYWGWVTKYGLENRFQDENVVQQIIRTVWNLTGKQVSPLVGGFSFSQHEISGKIPISLGFALLIIWSHLFRIPSFLQGQLQPPPIPSFYFNSSVLRWNLSAFKWTQIGMRGD